MPVVWTVLTTSTWIVMVIAIDHYVMLAYPLRAAQWSTARMARWVGTAVILLAVLFNLVCWQRYYFVSFHSSVKTIATYLSHLKDDIAGWNKDLYRDVYHISLNYIFIFIVHLTTISVMNLLLITGTTHDFKKELCDFISAVVNSVDFHVNEIYIEYYIEIKEALLVLGCAYNFYIYVLFYKRFRRFLAKLCVCFKPVSAQETSDLPTYHSSVQNHLRFFVISHFVDDTHISASCLAAVVRWVEAETVVLILADVSTVAPIDSADLWFQNKRQNYDKELRGRTFSKGGFRNSCPTIRQHSKQAKRLMWLTNGQSFLTYAISPYLRKADRVNIAIINAKRNKVVRDSQAAFAN
ncbi:hypothetical protein CAPTEDRAFT_213704 [Capitella teleta]|uniref:G-protein coupled receptors family 1 profile domain-containing protein n=1 Tax=Capitella teleta TaxID=283909 RepID=R7TDR4_CAPTE|nr:hypothetical protein CAPTEDRAFT_213704 [Capitella teleta]|eukprot:ELT89206.1 hypothetical protein CAPTEDRAFT_213704 [Capitella teleta]